MNIIILEFVDEARLMLKQYGKSLFSASDVIVVALDPKVKVFLKNNGIQSRSTLDYLDTAGQQRIILKTQELTNKLIEDFLFRDKFGIENGYRETIIHHLRFYINHFLWVIEILSGIKEKHLIKEIYCCLPKERSGMYVKTGYIHNQERFLGFLTKDFCNLNGITFCGVYLKAQKSYFILLSRKIIHKVGEFIALIDYLLIIRGGGKRKTILVPTFTYGMGRLLREIKERHPEVRSIMIWETDPTVKNDLQKTRLIFSNFFKRMAKKEFVENIIPLDLISGRFKKDHEQQLEIEREFRNLILRVESLSKEEATHNNVSFTVYLKEKIGFGLRNEILKLQHSTSLLNNVFSRLKPELLMGMYSVGIYYMMGEFSHRMDFVSLNISHGTHVPPNNKFEEIENYCLARTVILNTYKHVAVQTPWADKFLDYYKDERPRVYSGPLLYSVKNARARVTIREQVLGKGNNARIIVHASTQKTRDSLRFHIEESLDEYICSLSDIVNAVNKLDDVYFIIRPHPICDISEEEFAELLPSCRRLKVIKKKRPFSDILSIADLLISYSSTCIEEALQSNIPVILFDRWRRYNHFNLEETKSENQIARNAAYYITRPEILPKAIPGILDIYDKEPLGDEELLNYKYPADYRSNFYSFVKQALGRET